MSGPIHYELPLNWIGADGRSYTPNPPIMVLKSRDDILAIYTRMVRDPRKNAPVPADALVVILGPLRRMESSGGRVHITQRVAPDVLLWDDRPSVDFEPHTNPDTRSANT
jgi:hypothetical protein